MKSNLPHHYSADAETIGDLEQLVKQGWRITAWLNTKPGVIRLTVTHCSGGGGAQETVFAGEAMLREAGWLRPVLSAKRRRKLEKRGDHLAAIKSVDSYGSYVGWLRVPAGGEKA